MMRGRNALVTGSTRGIGAAIAEALAAEGCNVLITGFGEQTAIDTERKRLADTYGVTVEYHDADLADLAALDNLVGAAETLVGPVGILVNNAVIRYFHRIDDFPRDAWQHALAVNLTAPFALTQKVLPGMRERNWGRIVNFSSVLGMAARAGRADYITCKTALLGLTRATAAETQEFDGITCNAICPGSVLTPNTEMKIGELADEEVISFADAKQLYRTRRGQAMDYIDPARVAKLVAFLCQDSSFDITGAGIPIDQGRSATWLE